MSYADQLMLNLDGAKDAAGGYLAYTSIFLPPSLFVVGFLGNVLSPYFRKQGNRLRSETYRWLLGYAVVGLMTTSLCLGVGIVLGHLVGRFQSGINWPLAAAVLFMALLRYTYLLPNSMLGVFATPRELDQMLLVSGISVAMMVGVYWLLREVSASALVGVVGAVLSNLIVRNLYGSWLVWRIFCSGRELRVEA